MAIEEREIRSGTIDELAQTVSDADKRELIHTVQSAPDVCFTWDYERSRPHLAKLQRTDWGSPGTTATRSRTKTSLFSP